MKTLIGVVAVLTLAAGVSAQQQQTTPPTTPPDKPTVGQTTPAPTPTPAPATKADPSSLAGTWDMTIDSDQGPMAITLVFKQDGKKLTGTLTSQMGDTALTGEFAEGKVTFSISFDAGSGPMDIGFTGAMKDDGSLNGSMNGPMGEMGWKATRTKS